MCIALNQSNPSRSVSTAAAVEQSIRRAYMRWKQFESRNNSRRQVWPRCLEFKNTHVNLTYLHHLAYDLK